MEVHGDLLAAAKRARQRNLSSKLKCRHIEISGAHLPLTDTGADQSQGAKGGRIFCGLTPLANSSVLGNDATVLNAMKVSFSVKSSVIS